MPRETLPADLALSPRSPRGAGIFHNESKRTMSRVWFSKGRRAHRPAEDVRQRKLALATGQGAVHGRTYRLAGWGLDEVQAA